MSEIEIKLETKLPANNIWNVDETGFNCDQGKLHILCKKGINILKEIFL